MGRVGQQICDSLEISASHSRHFPGRYAGYVEKFGRVNVSMCLKM